MRTVGVGADRNKKKSAEEIVLEKEVKSLKTEIKQLKADNKKLLEENKQLKAEQES